MTQSGITATPIMVRSTLEKMPNVRRVVTQISSPTSRDYEGLRARGVSGTHSGVSPWAGGAPGPAPAPPAPPPPPTPAATATPGGPAPAARATRDNAGNETQRGSADDLVQHGPPEIAWRGVPREE